MTENNTQLKGAITQQKCFLKCIQFGWIISKPLFDNARYDFIADNGKKLLRIQIKTSAWNEDHTAFTFNGYSQHSTGDGNKRMKYTNKEIDYFMTEKDNQFYLYPAEQEGFVSKCLRLTSSSNCNQSRINWAKNYLFQEVVKNF